MSESKQILFAAVKNHLKGVMNGKTTLPTKEWKTEYNNLIAEKKQLDSRYITLKDEVKEAE